MKFLSGEVDVVDLMDRDTSPGEEVLLRGELLTEGAALDMVKEGASTEEARRSKEGLTAL